MKAPEPQKEHQWLQKMVGEWTCEGEMSMGPDQPPMKWSATETVRPLGDVWVVFESNMKVPEGGAHVNVLTLGYDPAKKRFVGTFVGSMMTNMWVYDGALDASGSKLVLDTVGPSMTDPAKSAKYQDIVEYKSNNERVLSSQVQNDDGTWQPFMSTTYRRKQ
jgi:hypothetical protein